MIQIIEKHFEESKISRSGQNNKQDSVLPNSSNNKTLAFASAWGIGPLAFDQSRAKGKYQPKAKEPVSVLSSAESVDPQVKLFRHKYLINPRPNFIDYSFSLTDIITSKYFYMPVIVILSYYSISYHNEILTGVNVVSNTILDWYNWWFNIRPGGGTTDLLNTNNTQNLAIVIWMINSVVDKSLDISRPNTPIIDSIRVEETWNSGSSTPTPSSPNSTGSSTPTNTISLTPTFALDHSNDNGWFALSKQECKKSMINILENLNLWPTFADISGIYPFGKGKSKSSFMQPESQGQSKKYIGAAPKIINYVKKKKLI